MVAKANYTTSVCNLFRLYSVVVLLCSGLTVINTAAVASSVIRYGNTHSSQPSSKKLRHFTEERVGPSPAAIQDIVRSIATSWLGNLFPQNLWVMRLKFKPTLENGLPKDAEKTANFFGSQEFLDWDHFAASNYEGDEQIRDKLMIEVLLERLQLPQLLPHLRGDENRADTLATRQRFDAALLNLYDLQNRHYDMTKVVLPWINSKHDSEQELAGDLFKQIHNLKFIDHTKKKART
ncbi:uncharacterized protein PHALS_09041 [Plasmopara halstedii]|uniref:Uncharacterized protein n=1 Tax=Plasmopara halstedii TaxID=4781 RepID=A0A0P1A558_PLAHL|nr:uncharacterized protein PHALS_09041 [Plasmopara halstedii]CEG35229.1 hypothetical protein PHALS_09041 [Plasmopara halstedii]|eukprot:XP_024571598.1 hypothetical protein PHALS_09041 [Plasmopara halstedii]